jgi:hypothetical protein
MRKLDDSRPVRGELHITRDMIVIREHGDYHRAQCHWAKRNGREKEEEKAETTVCTGSRDRVNV